MDIQYRERENDRLANYLASASMQKKNRLSQDALDRLSRLQQQLLAERAEYIPQADVIREALTSFGYELNEQALNTHRERSKIAEALLHFERSRGCEAAEMLIGRG